MKINGTIFSKPQQDQLKRGIGAELEKVVEKVDDVDKRMLNYKGDWVSGDEYHENDVVTWATDGHLYEVIKTHTSSASFDPDNPEYYKAMTKKVWIEEIFVGKTNEYIAIRLNELMLYDPLIIVVYGDEELYFRKAQDSAIGLSTIITGFITSQGHKEGFVSGIVTTEGTIFSGVLSDIETGTTAFEDNIEGMAIHSVKYSK